MLLPKTKRIKSRKHQEFVVTFFCLLSGHGCRGYIQAHHLLQPWHGVRGVGMRAGDNNTVPMCNYHHTQLHKYGDEDKFWTQFGYTEEHGRDCAKELWELFNEGKNVTTK
tara:strand:- start:423 stop:752 length:330 start_codon:yes stop_codon:yes gene_type:complete